MRNANDMMEDTICEDTMMECSGDGGGLEDLVNLASDIADSAPSIRDAAARLLTLLGVDEDDDASSSEDEGVEVDLEDSDSEEPQDTRLLHQLAASLAQELKYAKQNSSNIKLLAQSENVAGEIYRDETAVQNMELSQEANQVTQSITQFSQINVKSSNHFGSYSTGLFYQSDHDDDDDNDDDDELLQSSHIPRHPPPPYQYKSSNFSQFENPSHVHNANKNFSFDLSNFQNYTTQLQNQTEIPIPAYLSSSSSAVFNSHIRIPGSEESRLTDPVSWGVGWEACASEALRYLVEDEGLPPHHPTVVAMKNHLDLQRSRVVSHFAS